MSNVPNPENIHEVDHEPVPVKVYVGVLVALLFLTFVTVAVSYIDFRGFDLHVAMLVALMKASLVVAYFMNLRQKSDRMNLVVFLTGLFFLFIFMIPTFWDYATRDAVDPTSGEYIEMTPRYPLGSQGGAAE